MSRDHVARGRGLFRTRLCLRRGRRTGVRVRREGVRERRREVGAARCAEAEDERPAADLPAALDRAAGADRRRGDARPR